MMGWAVLELTSKGEKEAPEIVRKALLKHLPGAEIYIPALETQIGDDKVTHYLMSGYAFVRMSDPPRPIRAFRKLEGTKYVNAVLQQGGKIAPVKDDYIEEMKEKIRAEVNQGIGVGDTVEICSGPFKHIEASVIVELPETKEVQVFVQLRSKQAVLTLPRSVLKVVDRAPLSPFFARLGYLKAWALMAKVLLAYDVPYDKLQQLHANYRQVSAWMKQGAQLYSVINFVKGSLDQGVEVLSNNLRLLSDVDHWIQSGKKLYSFIFFEQQLSESRVSDLKQKYLQLIWLDSVEARVTELSRDVESLARDMAYTRKNSEDTMTVHNVVVDGHNLAHRCFHAPGMGILKDSEGNPTGVVIGFLRSLGSLKKRYPEAKFWVTWDGSSQRRRKLYHDYKSGRSSAKFEEQEKFIRGVLPLLGVRQAWNPEEEADDVVGTLVREVLDGERNLIFSNDRDFLQLVTENTLLLVPAIGSRKEVLFDPQKVEQAFGVPPGKVVELRAFYGDKSDVLPGVPRVPKKVLRALVETYGSVAGVYASGLAGLNKGQYDRLRTAESQVRINREVMLLVEVPVTRLDPDVDVVSAAQKLRSRGIDPDPVISAFFGKNS